MGYIEGEGRNQATLFPAVVAAKYTPQEPETPDPVDTHSRFGSTMASSTACAPSLS